MFLPVTHRSLVYHKLRGGLVNVVTGVHKVTLLLWSVERTAASVVLKALTKLADINAEAKDPSEGALANKRLKKPKRQMVGDEVARAIREQSWYGKWHKILCCENIYQAKHSLLGR